MIRNLGRDFFKWLPISRCDLDHGSGVSQPRPAGMGPASGNFGAMKLLMPLWFSAAGVRIKRRFQRQPPFGEGYCPFAEAIPLPRPTRYIRTAISSVT